MITDNENLLSNEQAITGDAASTNYIDLGASKDVGAGEPLKPFLRVTEAFNNLTSLTVKIELDAAADFGTKKTLVEKTIALAALTKGSLHPLPSPPAGVSGRYLRAYYDVTGTDPTTGKVTLGFAEDKPANVGAVA